jgi:hypothetical protein
MADRAAARLFGKFFEFLAKDLTQNNKDFALELWGMTGDYDFAPYQIGEDDALEELGLLRFVEDEDGDLVADYADSRGDFEDGDLVADYADSRGDFED